MLRSFVISGVILGAKNDAEYKNDICKTLSQSLVVHLGNFEVNRVVLRQIFIFPAFVMAGIILGVKRYAGYENIVTEWIS